VFDVPVVIGDPAGMGVLGTGGLSGDADSVAVVAAGAAAMVDGLEFYGPAAIRIDASVRGSSRAAGGLAERLLELSVVLRRAVLEVEAEL
jgi:hypothetical protein